MLGIIALLALSAWLAWRRFTGHKAKPAAANKSGQRLWGAYTVKQGDTVSSLAVSHKVSQQKVRALNKLDDNHVLQAGEKIFLPRN